MKVGYIRVSTISQDYNAQHKLLTEAGCEKIFSEKISRRSEVFPVREQCFEYLREGDTLYVVRIDRIGGNQFEIINFLHRLEKKHVCFCCLTQNINTNTPEGKFFIMGLAYYAELELKIKNERVAEARAAGRIPGRKRGLTKEARQTADKAANLYLSRAADGTPSFSVSEIAKTLGISKRTLYKYLDFKNIALNRSDTINFCTSQSE